MPSYLPTAQKKLSNFFLISTVLPVPCLICSSKQTAPSRRREDLFGTEGGSELGDPHAYPYPIRGGYVFKTCIALDM